jgi:prepilin signal peptidase PulO-like enzyme (type II secretory pathway)
MLVAMTILCMIDLWEKVVPNKILLVWLVVFIIIIGFQGLYDMDVVLSKLIPIGLGLLFCMLTFGLGYIISHGSMGAGDVKLLLIMGLFLTSEYVVESVLYGCIASALYSIVMLLRKKVTRKDEIPFVPFLYLGLIIRYLMG